MTERSMGMDKAVIENHFKGNFQLFYRPYLQTLQKESGDELKAICPFHEDHNPSLSVNNQTGLYKCFGCDAAGSVFDFYARTHDMALPGDFPKVLGGIAKDFGIHNGNGNKQTGKPTVAARYDYRDETGTLIYQIERLEPKNFRIRRPDGQGWAYNAKGVKITPYHLQEVLKADEVLIVEGEKDADTLAKIGFTTTTNPYGAGKFPANFGPYFAGKNVVLIPDNDDQGRQHMKQVAEIIKAHAASIRYLEIPGLPEKGDVSDFIASFSSKEAAAERLAILIESAPLYKQPGTTTDLKIINAADWLESEPAEPDQIMENTFDASDKVAIIGSSKLRKSFFLQQMILSMATGRDFLIWKITKPRKILHCQFEIKDHHFHRRIKRMARAMGITAEDLGDRLQIINARGLGISGPEGIERIQAAAQDFHPEVFSFDPLYKLTTGVENDAQDAKIILNSFDKLAEQTGAAPIYVHHDAKGSPGDRDIRDRGAGSNVLGRDYDACIVLTAHSQDPDATVVEILLRNYRPQEPFTIQWTEDEATGGYRFEERPDILPEKKTSKTKATPPALSIYLPIAVSILGNKETEVGTFKTTLKTQTGLSDHRIRDFLTWATSGGNPPLLTREERGRGLYKKMIKVRAEVTDEE
jgi:hypothetical protein